MSKTLSSNKGYSGGSPRIRHENSTIKVEPKLLFNSAEFVKKIEKNYILHNITKQDLIYLIDYFATLISPQTFTGEKNENTFVCNYISIIENLYADGEINTNSIQIIINLLVNVKNNTTPPPKKVKKIKTEGEINTINKYNGSILNITKEKKQQTPIEKKVSSLDLDSVISVINKYYLEDIITKEQIENLNNSFKVLNGDSIELNILPNFLKKINILVSNAFTDGRLSQNKLLSLISKVNIILDNEKPIKIKPKKIIKNHISNLAPGYKK